MLLSVTSCNDWKKPLPNTEMCYAYFEFSDDVLEIYDITISVRDIELDKLMDYNFNTEKPYRRDEQNKRNAYFIKCDTQSKRPILFTTRIKKTKDYKFFDENKDRRFEMYTGYSFHEQEFGESIEDAMDALFYSCTRNLASYSGAMMSAPNPAGPPLYEYFANEFIKATEKNF